MWTNEQNIIENFVCFKVEPEPGAGPLHRLRLRPKSTGSGRLRNTAHDHNLSQNWGEQFIIGKGTYILFDDIKISAKSFTSSKLLNK